MEKLNNLKDIFNGRLLRVPDYQRGYAWGKEQLDDFWDDVQNLTEGRKHYTGMLSLRHLTKKETKGWEEEQWALGNFNCFHVVDGQQRLTTFIILLVCILNAVRSLSKNKVKPDDEIAFSKRKLKDIVNDFIVTANAEFVTEKAYKFGYEVDNPSFNYLRQEVFGEKLNEEISKSFYTLNLKNAKLFFESKIESLSPDNEDVLEEDLRVIYQKITQDLLFVEQEISDDFDVFVAFETMNNRGRPLSTLEKLKNRLIYLTTLYDHAELPETRYINLRKEINEGWAEVYKQLGRNELWPINDDDYLHNHYYLYEKYSRSENFVDDLLHKKFTAKSVLAKGQEHLKPAEIEKYVNDLSRTSKFWYYTYNPSEWTEISQEEQKWIEKLNRLELAYFRPLIVAAYMNDKPTPEERLSLLKAIERFVFVLFRTLGFKSQFRSSTYYSDAKKLKDGTITIQEIISSLDEAVDNNMDILGGFSTKIDQLFGSREGFYTWEGIKHFLFEYEQEKVDKNGSPKIAASDFFKRKESDRLTIEHIYPQTHNTVYYWANGFRFFDENQKVILCNSLGNLLPLASSINSEMQNYPYPEKRNGSKASTRRGYINGSYSEIEVANRWNEWTYSEIKERGIELLSFLERRWKVKIGDEQQKIKLLHLDFLSAVNMTVSELPRFPDVVKIVKDSGAKALRKEFWLALNGYFSSNCKDLYHDPSTIRTSYELWFDKKISGRTQLYVDIREGKFQIILFIGKEEYYNQALPLKADFDSEFSLDSDWISKNGTASYKRVVLYSVSFSFWDKSQWSEIIDKSVPKVNDFYTYFEQAFNEMNIDERKGPTRISEEDYMRRHSSNTGMSDMFKRFCAQVEAAFPEAKKHFTADYAAYEGKKDFVEIHIYSDKLRLNMIECGQTSSIGNKLPDNYRWPLMYKVEIKSDDDFPEAIRLMKGSYDSMCRE